MKSNQEININELVYLVRQNDEDALRCLAQALRGQSWEVCKRLCRWCVSEREWESIVLDTLQNTVIRYREREGIDFRTLYQSCLANRARDLARRSKRVYNSPGMKLVALEQIGSDGSFSMDSLCEASQTNTIEESVLCRVTCDQVFSTLAKSMHPVDLKILQMLRMGYAPREICRILDLHRDRVYQARKRAQAAWKKAHGAAARLD